MGNQNIFIDIQSLLGKYAGDGMLGCSHGAGRFQNDKVSGPYIGRYDFGCILDEVQIVFVVELEWRWHCKNKDIGLLRDS